MLAVLPVQRGHQQWQSIASVILTCLLLKNLRLKEACQSSLQFFGHRFVGDLPNPGIGSLIGRDKVEARRAVLQVPLQRPGGLGLKDPIKVISEEFNLLLTGQHLYASPKRLPRPTHHTLPEGHGRTPDAVTYCSSLPRRARRARCSRALTAKTLAPTTSATSSFESPSRSLRMRTTL